MKTLSLVLLAVLVSGSVAQADGVDANPGGSGDGESAQAGVGVNPAPVGGTTHGGQCPCNLANTTNHTPAVAELAPEATMHPTGAAQQSHVPQQNSNVQ